MADSLVSIVLPVYNGERYLRQSIESCLKQTHNDLELIIVDDASTDSTHEIIAAQTDPRIKVIINTTNQGLPRSLNIGFQLASGKYLTWTSADNLYAENAIESLLTTLQTDPGTGLVYGSFHLIDETGRVIGRKQCPQPAYLAKENTVGAYFLYRREVLRAVGGYDPNLRLAEDYDYWLRINERFTVRIVDADGYFYRVHDSSLTGTSRESEVLSAARSARRKSLSLLTRGKFLIYSTLNPIVGKMSGSRTGKLLRASLGGYWRNWGGR